MSYDNTQYDGLAFKASHNSYQRSEDVPEQLKWSETKPYNGGCRGLEFDFTRHSVSGNDGSARDYFQVTHQKGGEGPPLADDLGDLKSWHSAHPDHDPVFVTLDIKSEEGDVSTFPDEFDNYLRKWFSAPLLFTPAQVLQDSSRDLVGNLKKYGWPVFSTLRGKFIFCLSGTEDWKKTYSRDHLSRRLCFSDKDIEDTETSSPVTFHDRCVANVHLKSNDYDKWKKLVPSLHAGRLLVRGYVLDSKDIWDKAQGAGVNVLATDKVRNDDWAQVGGGAPFAKISA